MEPSISKLIEDAHRLQEQIEKNIEEKRSQFKYRLVKRKVIFEKEATKYHRQLKKNIFRFLKESKFMSMIVSPLIYAQIIPVVIFDIFVTLYQWICFPIYGIKYVKRSDYIAVDRHKLAYLNLIQKFNCIYCGYVQGFIAYSREIGSLTEQCFCPIKHARGVKRPHSRYYNFLEYGDAKQFHQKKSSSED